MDDAELARRSVVGFAEIIAALGRWGVDPSAELRRPGLLGARVDAMGDNPWMNAAVVLPGASPPEDDPDLPFCLWTLAGAAPGRVEFPGVATPCLGVELDAPALPAGVGAAEVGTPTLAEVGAINERAYGQSDGVFRRLVQGLRPDGRVRTHGLRVDGAFVSVMLTLTVDDDLSIQYVATEEAYRRRGLASGLIAAVTASARAEGLRSATLQASPDGLPVYLRLGFRRVATLRGSSGPSRRTLTGRRLSVCATRSRGSIGVAGGRASASPQRVGLGLPVRPGRASRAGARSARPPATRFSSG
ncbi:MAG: GNAT family N-acetyltransferase [Isosphaeraceae bacterium]